MSVQINPPRDPNTLSNYTAWRTKHTITNFDISFEQQRLIGNVVLRLESVSDSECKEIILDTSYLDIKDIKVDKSKVKWSLLPRLEPYGEALNIELEKSFDKGSTVDVDISLATTKSCTALQWLTPEQTSNKKHPYMFSQCQAIHARSIFPCQDTPDVKSTIDFNITSPLPVIASGIEVKNASEKEANGNKPTTYSFQQKLPIPAYLYAIASGDIVEAPIGPRSVVATGPNEVKDCQWELERDTESFIQVAEKIVYPYAWGQYNVLILPGSFPYGGMENPIFTFATDTIISKDRENVDVIAHELAHSWSGNLVSNASWEHFWLNEGWTVYLERRIIAGIHGEPHRDFSAIIGWKALTDSIERFGEDHEFTKLIVDLKGKDPDDAFSSIPYEKGFHFLYYLEKLLTKPKFDKFIPYYFTKWKGKSLDSYDFKATILEFFASDAGATNLLTNTVDWDHWFYSPGYPPKPKFDTTLVDAVYDLASKWETHCQSSTTNSSPFKPSPSDISNFSSNQLIVLLERILLFPTPLHPSSSHLLGTTYSLTSSSNVELTSRYCQTGLVAHDPTVLEPTKQILKSVGRMKFVRPLYKKLRDFDENLAKSVFEENKNFYHPICRGMVEKDLFS
ncbi:putative leukotriene a4 hydrolase [Phaeomoniella chlamydospora]|uniref:Leukotriene A(4) hydrolase n=1 Tax=Phaeomoniella chlamydospora TaxID=158046 RepID=A0A0G2DYY2_PHACM|nr:putative leukotriene a4 hydrolase [Phaeomoniella chlamydospora]